MHDREKRHSLWDFSWDFSVWVPAVGVCIAARTFKAFGSQEHSQKVEAQGHVVL